MEDSFYINKVTIGYVMELAILYADKSALLE